jgi:general secretion pathway protein B
MSYILDALKKAEQERKRGKTPDFMDNHGRSPQQPKKRLWLYALITVVIAVAGGLGWWFGHDKPAGYKLPFQSSGAQSETAAQGQKPETQQPAAPEPVQPAQPAAVAKVQDAPAEKKADAPKAGPAKETKPPAKPEALKKPAKEPANADAKAQQTAADTENKPDPKKLYSYNELPDEIKKEVPQLFISTHMYSNDSADRLVSINGNIGREKQEIMPGITLDAILPDGAILRHKGYRFKIGLR